MIKIGFDARMIRHSGIGVTVRALLAELTRREDLDFTLFGDLDKIADYPARKVRADFPIYSLREQLIFPQLLRKNPVQLLHVPHYNAPLGWRGPLVTTVHDLIHIKLPPSRSAYAYARVLVEAVCRKSKAILADSECTRRDILEIVPGAEARIRVVYPAVSEDFLKAAAQFPRKERPDPYLLYVGNVRRSKNVEGLVRAFLLAREKAPDLCLVLAGRDAMPDFTRRFAGRSDLRFAGEVNSVQLLDLYVNARAFVFPSLYEGFGLPPLEAMACGVPVACSRAASLPEVVGEAALLFDPADPAEMAEKMLSVWSDGGLRRDLAGKGAERVKAFSWKRASDQVARVYEECA